MHLLNQKVCFEIIIITRMSLCQETVPRDRTRSLYDVLPVCR